MGCVAGQDALLRAHPDVSTNPFQAIVPPRAMYSGVAVSIGATIVASRVLISDVFFQVLHEQVVLLLISNERVPESPADKRITVEDIGEVFFPLERSSRPTFVVDVSQVA